MNEHFPIVSKTIGVARLHKRAIEGAIDYMGINRSQHQILMALSHSGKINSQKEFAERIGVTPAAITQLLSSLEAEGLIERRQARDSRYNEILITERGRRIVESSKERFNFVDNAMFEGFSEEDKESFFAYLCRLEDNLKAFLEVND